MADQQQEQIQVQDADIVQAQNKKLDHEQQYDDENEALYAEHKASLHPPKINQKALPMRSYLDQAVTPYIFEALKAVEKERPNDPIEFFAYYLITHNPYNPQTTKEL